MPALSKQETISFHDLYKKSYLYLNDNFHKFNEKNKIQVAIAICKMSVPQTMKMEHAGSIIMSMPEIKKGKISLEFNIGGRTDSPENTGHPEQAPPANYEL